MQELSDTQYARSGDLHIAFRTAGEGPPDLLIAPGYLTHVEQNLEWEPYRACLEALARFSRVIVFDRRGSGLSDRLRDEGDLDEVMEDIGAVLDAVGAERAFLVGLNDGGPLCSVYAAAHPERCSGLVLFGAAARGTQAPDYPWAPTPEEHEAVLRRYERDFGRRPVAARYLAPSLAGDPAFRRFLLRSQRYGASPGAAIAWYRLTMQVDVRDVLPAIRVPTLVLHRTGGTPRAVGAARHLAESIPGARLVGLPGDEQMVMAGDWRPVVAELEAFVTGTRPQPRPDRVLASVLFTDIVDSTALAARIGDEAWRELLATHNRIVRGLLAEHGGREVNTTGDGFVAAFDRPGAAIRCAAAIREAVRGVGVDVRAGLHAGEVELLGEDVGGVAVHIAARVLGTAAAGEVLVTRTVRDLVAGSGIAFEPRGEHVLKGLEEPWQLHAVLPGAGAPG